MKTVIALALLLGILPVWITAGVVKLALTYTPLASLPDFIGGLITMVLYIGLVAGGAYTFTYVKS